MPRLIYLFTRSTIINSIILGLSVLATLLFVFFLLSINASSMAPSSFVDDVTKLVIDRQYDEAAKLCRSYRRTFAASVILRCVENAGKQHSVIMDMLDSEGKRRADIVWNRISYLADIANVAPMLGLLGTVIGMIKAFFVLPQQYGNITSKVLSEGVGQAMATTMFGLAVAILALVFYSIVKSRATRTLAEVEQVVHSVADHIKRGGQ
jgi:biopolymer transport protein ExbB